MNNTITNPFIHIQEPPQQRFYEPQPQQGVPEITMNRRINFKALSAENARLDNPDITMIGDDPVVTTKKRGRPKKDPNAPSKNEEIAVVSGELSYAQSNVPYSRSFDKTNAMLEVSVNQIDALSSEVHTELENVRNSRTLKGRYTYISDLTATASSLLSTKITAIREMNNVINQGHKLDLDRMKALKLNESQGNDDMQIQALYNAYINTPINAGYNPLAFNSQDALMIDSNVQRVDVTSIGMQDDDNFSMGSITPEQNRMLLEDNPNIKTVVVYDQSDPNHRYFDVIDTTTGQSVPNYPRPDPIFMEETTINPITGVARNANINATWPVVVIGHDPNLENF